VNPSGRVRGSFYFIHFVTLRQAYGRPLDGPMLAGADRRGPSRCEGVIARLQDVRGLAAHAGGAGREGYRPACGEGNDEGDSLGRSPFTAAAGSAGLGEEVHREHPVGSAIGGINQAHPGTCRTAENRALRRHVRPMAVPRIELVSRTRLRPASRSTQGHARSGPASRRYACRHARPERR